MTSNSYALSETSFCWGKTSRFLSHEVENFSWAWLFLCWSNACVYWNLPCIMQHALTKQKEKIIHFTQNNLLHLPTQEPIQASPPTSNRVLGWILWRSWQGKINSVMRAVQSVGVDWGLSIKLPDLDCALITKVAKQTSLLLPLLSAWETKSK